MTRFAASASTRGCPPGWCSSIRSRGLCATGIGLERGATHDVPASLSLVGMATASSGPWSREEVEATVADYLQMLRLELAGQPYNKAAHHRDVANKLNNRTPDAVGMKNQNISAILLEHKFTSPATSRWVTTRSAVRRSDGSVRTQFRSGLSGVGASGKECREARCRLTAWCPSRSTACDPSCREAKQCAGFCSASVQAGLPTTGSQQSFAWPGGRTVHCGLRGAAPACRWQ